MDTADVEHSPAAVIASDRKGVIRYWNKGAEHIFRHSGEAAVGQSLDLIIPEKELRERLAACEEAADTKV